PLFERFVGALAEKARSLRLGWPTEPDTTMGPLISRAHQEKVLSYYALARREGAEAVVGGGVPSFGDRRDGGSWIEPTVFVGLPESARTMREEIFGPVCHIAPF